MTQRAPVCELKPRAIRSLDGSSLKVPADGVSFVSSDKPRGDSGVIAAAIQQGRTAPGPGHYDTFVSPYANALPRYVPGPNSFSAEPPRYDMFPVGDPNEPGPGQYKLPRGASPAAGLGKGDRRNFIDDAVTTYEANPGPGQHQLSTRPPSGGRWGAPSGHKALVRLPTPSPQEYDTRSAAAAAELAQAGARSSFSGHGPRPSSVIDWPIAQSAGKPGPGTYAVRTGLGADASAGLYWGGTDEGLQGRTPFVQGPEGPGPAAYALAPPLGAPPPVAERGLPRRSRSANNGSPNHAGEGALRGGKSPSPSPGASRGFGGIVAEAERRGRAVPGPGQYDITSSPYTQSLATSIPAPHLVSNPPSGMFGGNSTPAPDTYNPLYPSSSSPGANGLSQGPRKSVVDAAAAAAADTPAPHDYDPRDPRFTHHSSSSQKEWPPNSVPFVFAPPSDTPGPGGPLPGSMGTFPLGGVNLGKGSERVAFTESIAKANAWKVATGLHDPPVPEFAVREAPSIASRFETCMVVPDSIRGENRSAFQHALTSEKTGGFRKLGNREVVMDYRARLRHTKDGALAYTLPSTLTTLAVVADESSYPKSGDGGTWLSVPTGGAIPVPSWQDNGGGSEGHGRPPSTSGTSKGSRRSSRRRGTGEVSSSASPQPSPRTAAIADALARVEGAPAFPPKHKPRAPQFVKHHYELVARLGRGQARVNKFVTTAIAAVEAAESAKEAKAKRVREARQEGQSADDVALQGAPAETKFEESRTDTKKMHAMGLLGGSATAPVATMVPLISRSKLKSNGALSPPSSSSPSPSRKPARSSPTSSSSPNRSTTSLDATKDMHKITSRSTTQATTGPSTNNRSVSTNRSSKRTTGLSSAGNPQTSGLNKPTNHNDDKKNKKLSMGGAGLAVKMEVQPCDPLYRAAFGALAQRRSDELDYQRDLARGGDIGGDIGSGDSTTGGSRKPKAWWAD